MLRRSRKRGASVREGERTANAHIHKNVYSADAAEETSRPGRQVQERFTGNVAGVRAMPIKLYLRQLQATFYLRDLYMLMLDCCTG